MLKLFSLYELSSRLKSTNEIQVCLVSIRLTDEHSDVYFDNSKSHLNLSVFTALQVGLNWPIKFKFVTFKRGFQMFISMIHNC